MSGENLSASREMERRPQTTLQCLQTILQSLATLDRRPETTLRIMEPRDGASAPSLLLALARLEAGSRAKRGDGRLAVVAKRALRGEPHLRDRVMAGIHVGLRRHFVVRECEAGGQ